MTYSREKRLDIGRRIYEGELTTKQAALTRLFRLAKEILSPGGHEEDHP